MCRLEEHTMLAFQDELRKLGAVPWQALGGNVGGLMGTGAAIGAGIGGLRSASRRFHEAKDEGESTGSALLHAGLSGVGGALEGSAVGGGLGAAAGAAGTALAPELTGNLAKRVSQGVVGGPGRFGQRQVHAFTGWRPTAAEGGLKSIGVEGSQELRDAQSSARAHLEELRQQGADPREIAKAERHHATLGSRAESSEEVERRGMGDLPGAVRSLRQDPVGTLRTGLQHQWRNSGKVEKALMLGAPVLDTAATLAGREDPEHGKGERLGRNIGGLAAGAALAGAPLGVQLAGGMLAGPMAGGMVGRVVDKFRNRGIVNRKPELEPVDNQQNVPIERNMSPAAMGMAPEGMGG
jgi:hypothetical protein